MISLSDETEVLARRLAEVQHVTVEDAVRQAVEARATRQGSCRNLVGRAIFRRKPPPLGVPGWLVSFVRSPLCRFSTRAPRKRSWMI
jgi:hypothetical protein